MRSILADIKMSTWKLRFFCDLTALLIVESVAAGTLTAPALPANSSEYIKGFRDRRLANPIDSYHAYDDTCVSYVLPACHAAWPVCTCSSTTAYNVSLISSSLDLLYIGEVHYPNSYSSNRMCAPSCLHTKFIPLPRLPNLRSIALINIWVAPDDRPFPVGRFLRSVQLTLTELSLKFIYLPTITQSTFAGFAALDRLELSRNRMSAVAVDAFSQLTPTLAPPTLRTMWISENAIPRLDWCVWEPLAQSLEAIFLEQNEIEEVYLSHDFVMPKVGAVRLAANKLIWLDERLLASVSSGNARPFLEIEYNPFCLSDADCDCPSLRPLWKWLKKLPRRYVPPGRVVTCCYGYRDRLTCGPYRIDPRKRSFEKYIYTPNVTGYYSAQKLFDLADSRQKSLPL